MKQTPVERAGFGISYWRKMAKDLQKENKELKAERDLWKAKALELMKGESK